MGQSVIAPAHPLDAPQSPLAIAIEREVLKIERGLGRPTDFEPELAARIVHGMATGHTLLALSREDWCPGVSSIYRWLEERPDFRDVFWRARVMQSHSFADQAIECPDKALASLQGDKSDNARVNAWRVKYEALKWRAGCYNPEYRDKGQPFAQAGSGVTVVISGLADPAKVIEG